ncbi:hypothetical protein HELRODRAFT_158504 [Helobdella robusta]|uniref:Uncharacterized protein n=1 Tax=Helobdella robusta TaxID=6412 RepID=T1EMV3_HELRO|nr:hypothetical protein HELRODRAFT_158504 [Helobdella robusta]ESO12083.1 hypothetical protein HELRODRAFT_158504 [Helobdella robusta]
MVDERISDYNNKERLMKRAVRIVTGSKRKDHSQPLFNITRNLNFSKLNIYFEMIFVYKQLTNRLPELFQDYYSMKKQSRKPNNLVSNKSKTNIMFSHIFCKGPRTWNEIVNSGFDVDFNSLHSLK